MRCRICFNNISNTDSSIQINFFIVSRLIFKSRYKSSITSSTDEICPFVISYCLFSVLSIPQSPYSQAKVFHAGVNPARSGLGVGFWRNHPRPEPCGIAPENLAGFPARPFKPACTGTPAPKCRINANINQYVTSKNRSLRLANAVADE